MSTEGNAPYDVEGAQRFYSKLRRRVAQWLEKNTSASERVRAYLLLLPDFFALLIRLIGDPRVDAKLKGQLILVSAYVISPVDLIPDFLLPLGLVDDAVAIVFMLGRLAKIMGETGEEVLREHWEGEGDVLEQMRKLAQEADVVLNQRVLGKLRDMVSGRRQGGAG